MYAYFGKIMKFIKHGTLCWRCSDTETTRLVLRFLFTSALRVTAICR